MANSARPAAVGFIFVTLLLDIIGLGIIIPVIPQLIQELTGADVSEASRYGGWLLFAYAFFQFLFAPLVGALSDRYGRRPVLLLSLLGFGLDYLVLAFAPTLAWLFVARVVSGIFGASFTTGFAYIADVSPPEKRAQNFGLVGAAFGLGFIIGPVTGGILGELGPRVPFFVAAALTLLNMAYGYFVLPESLPAERRRPFEWKRANPLGTLLALRRYPQVIGLISSLVFVYIASHAVQGTWAYFTIEKFNWSPKDIGLSLGAVGILSAFVQGFLIRKAIPALGAWRTLIVGMVCNVTGLVLFALVQSQWMLYAFLIPYAFGGLAGPALQGLLSNGVPENEQGELQGAMSSMMSATSIVGPPLMTTIFATFTEAGAPIYFPGAPFVAGAVLSALSLVLILGQYRKSKL
ncbi:MAG: TCR/Tet family MFS transporter [Bacteroidota bacterium]|jgi:DHA1 family tetracycline resistance protein-like MFS transporter